MACLPCIAPYIIPIIATGTAGATAPYIYNKTKKKNRSNRKKNIRKYSKKYINSLTNKQIRNLSKKELLKYKKLYIKDKSNKNYSKKELSSFIIKKRK